MSWAFCILRILPRRRPSTTSFAASWNLPERKSFHLPACLRSFAGRRVHPRSFAGHRLWAYRNASRQAESRPGGATPRSNFAGALGIPRSVKFSRQEKLKPETWCGSIPQLCSSAKAIAPMRTESHRCEHCFSLKVLKCSRRPCHTAPGPSACLHLMSLMSLLDEQTALVDLPWLAVETVELLKSRGFRLIEIEYSERDYAGLQCAFAGRQAPAGHGRESKNKCRNSARPDSMSRTFPGSELCVNGGGGPTCLTRPLLRTT